MHRSAETTRHTARHSLGARTLAVAAITVLYGTVGARQPAVRVALPLPVSAQTIADALEIPSADTATLMLDITRTLYELPVGQDAAASARREALRRALWTPAAPTADTVPLPLDPSIWRDTILEQRTPDHHLAAAILYNRDMSLLYYGLAALDDETLGWLGADRATLRHARDNAGVFAAFGRSIRVHAGRVVVPGGSEAEQLWADFMGVDPGKPGAFVQRVLHRDGRLAFLYDTIAHLDAPRRRFALGLHVPGGPRADRLRALYEVFAKDAPQWRVSDRPFVRAPLDGGVLLSAITVEPDGTPAGPGGRRFWELAFRGDEMIDVTYATALRGEAPRERGSTVDAAWLASRIVRLSYSVARRRLDTFAFAQRVFPEPAGLDEDALLSAVRSATAFPALALTMERMGIRDPEVYGAAARHAAALGATAPEPFGRPSLMVFQGVLALLERAHRNGGLPPAVVHSIVRSLCRLDPTPDGQYFARLSQWTRADLLHALPVVDSEATSPKEVAVLAAMAGLTGTRRAPATIEWEGRTYAVDPATAEFGRLRRIREKQGGASLDEALAPPGGDTPVGGAAEGARALVLAETLASIVYAAQLGEPDGQAVTSGNVALRHDFGNAPWRLPAEDFASRGGWRIRGSLLALETALGRLALRRLDPTSMPGEPRLGTTEVQALMLTAALLSPRAMSDSARDEIAATLGRGRARAAALTADPAELDRAARDAAVDEWERQALAWTAEHRPGSLAGRFDLMELYWLGAPRAASLPSLDAWGVSAQPVTGCLCLRMPRPLPAETLAGRPTTGILATRYADVAVQVADALAGMGLPAPLAPGVLQFALQEAIDRADPARPDDVAAFSRAAASLSRNRITDYVAALTAGGALVPVAAASQDHR